MSVIEISSFNFRGHHLRVVSEADGALKFVAADVAKILGHREAKDMTRSLDPDELHRRQVPTSAGLRETLVITEAGLYQSILQRQTGRMAHGADRAAVKEFQRWVTHEVLPTIHHHGVYLTPVKIEEVLADPDTIIRLATTLKAERAKRAELEREATKNASKVRFASAVESSPSTILVGELAKILKGNGVEIGQNRLFEWLRHNGFLVAGTRRSDYNMPTQKAMDLGLFEIRESIAGNPDGSVRVTKTAKVTGRGQTYFVSGFISGQFAV